MANIERMRDQFKRDGRDVRLVARGHHLRRRTTTGGPVVLPAVLQARPGLSRARRRSTGARSDQMVLAREQVVATSALLSAAARRSSSATWSSGSSASPNYAEELLDFDGIDWPERDPDDADATGSAAARARRSTSRSTATGDRDAIRVFTTRPDTVFGVDLHGAGAGASAGRAAHDAPNSAPRCEAYVDAGAARDRDRAHSDRAREDRRLHRRLRHQPDQRRARSRSGSPTTCCSPTAPARSWACPAHDERDFDVRAEVRPADPRTSSPPRRDELPPDERLHRRTGVMVNSGQFDGMPAPKAIGAVTARAGGARHRARRRSPTACATG